MKMFVYPEIVVENFVVSDVITTSVDNNFGEWDEED